MGKKKSVALMILLTVVIVVLCAITAFPVFAVPGTVEKWNPAVMQFDLSAEFDGSYYAYYYPEGVISQADYQNNLSVLEGTEKENYEEEFVLNEIKNLGIKKYNIILLNQITDGQASTAIVASDLIQDNDPILIFNIDTHVNPESLEKNILKHDGCIITTQVPGNN